MFCLFSFVLSRFSHVRLFATPWTVAHQTPLSMGFSKQEYWVTMPSFFLTLYPLQFSSVTQSCPTLCDPMNCSTPGLPVHQLLEFTQTHVHRVGDAIQPSHPLLSPYLLSNSTCDGSFTRFCATQAGNRADLQPGSQDSMRTREKQGNPGHRCGAEFGQVNSQTALPFSVS